MRETLFNFTLHVSNYIDLDIPSLSASSSEPRFDRFPVKVTQKKTSQRDGF